MKHYIITEKAGRFVAGRNNTGVGTVLELTPAEAEYEITLGTLVVAQAPAELADPAQEAGQDEAGDNAGGAEPKRRSRAKNSG